MDSMTGTWEFEGFDMAQTSHQPAPSAEPRPAPAPTPAPKPVVNK